MIRLLNVLIIYFCLLQTVVVYATDLSTSIALDAQKNNFAQVMEKLQLKEHQSQVNTPLNDGSTALLWASYHNHLAAIERLLELGADPNRLNRYTMSPLHFAAVNGNARAILALMQKGANLNHSIAGGETILMTAARTGDVASVKTLLDAKIIVSPEMNINAKDRKHQTALMWAAAEGNTAIVDLLLNAGADANTVADDGFTALFFATRAGHSASVARLLQAGVDVNTVITHTKKERQWARKGSSALIIALSNGHFTLATELLIAGADANDMRSGFSPLHYLIEVRKPDIGDQSDLPPQGSGTMNSLEFVEQLIAHKADLNIRVKISEKPTGASGARVNLEGATPLFMATKTADIPFVQLLIKHGADPLLTNVDGVTPLMMAAGLGTQAADEEAGSETDALTLIDFLLEKGADINAVSKTGETAMHGAAYKNFPLVIHHLAKKGADINIWHQKNMGGSTPIMIAQGFRPGNYKPSAKTEKAFAEVMLAAGVEPPPAPSRTQKKTYLE